MMKKLLYIIFLGFITYSCSNKKASFNENLERKSIMKVMDMQQEAWSNGDIETFMTGYWKSDSLTFTGRNGITYGWTTTLKNYKKGYSTKEDMGKLTFKIIKLNFVEPFHANMIGQYILTNDNNSSTGYFSLVWKKIGANWKIISDHTSA